MAVLGIEAARPIVAFRLPYRFALVATLLTCAAAARADVRLEGVSRELEANIRAHLRLDDEACDADAARIRYRYDAAARQIQAALRPFGYYASTVQGTLDLSGDDCWIAVFSIDPGPPVVFSKIEIDVTGEGAGLDGFQRILSRGEMIPGQPARHDQYEKVKNQLIVLARELGFFEAEFSTSELVVDPVGRTASVALVLGTGPRYRFGDLHIRGGGLKESLIRRYVGFEAGMPFERRYVRDLRNDLIQGGYFASVDVRTEPLADKRVDVHLEVTEARRIRYGVGLGFGTDTGVIVRFDAVNRRVNRAGHRLELAAELSKIRQSLTFDYRIPGKRPQSDWYSVYGGVNRQDSDAVESVGLKLGLRHNRFHTARWSSAPFVEYVHEWFVQDGDWQQRQALVPGYALVFRDAAVEARPTRGTRLKLEVAGASDSVISDTSFLRLWATGKKILPLFDRGRLLVRTEAGWMTTPDFDKVPPAWRFFAGGDSSVRGYDYQSLGPLDDEGRAVGGTRLLTGSLELDWRVLQQWSGALFVDAGNVGQGDLFRDLPWSIGLGARWYSPMGPIRVDLAFPQQGDNDFRVHVSMGPDI